MCSDKQSTFHFFIIKHNLKMGKQKNLLFHFVYHYLFLFQFKQNRARSDKLTH